MPVEQSKLLLPVFYLHLDPTPIPDIDTLEILMATATQLPCIDAAIISLRALFALGHLNVIPLDASPDLWPRVWEWLRFLHAYWTCLPGFRASDELDACIRDASLLLTLGEHPGTSTVISGTRGARQLLARVWVAFLDDPTRAPKSTTLSRLLPLLMVGLADDENFEEIVDGVGGTLRDLASVLLKQLSHAAAAPKSAYTVAGVGAVIAFLGKESDPNGPLHSALLSGALIPSLVSSLIALDGTNTAMTESTSAICLSRLIHYLGLTDGYPWMGAALKAGMLRGIIYFAIRAIGTIEPTTKEVFPRLKELVSVTLPRSLVSPDVVLQMKGAFNAVEHVSRSPQFMRSALFEEWKILTTVVQARVKVLDAWEAAGRESLRACDNMKCGQISMKRGTKCCSGCKTARYCCRGCQIVDWRDAHRDFCDNLGSVRRRYRHLRLAPRDQDFMRAIMHADYLRLRYTLSTDKLAFMVQHPGEPFFVCFDYARGWAAAGEVAGKGAFLALHDFAVELPMQWDRCARAGGQMEMHVALVSEGGHGDERPRLFPMRTSSSKFHDGLRRIADEVPPGADLEDYMVQLDPKLRDLIREVSEEVIEIH
ncbi:hypothetical protein FB451DRAFT_758101 [Mycena latifolia]|nr:hypothetical protein FB451DRAFT_758101 [Mycena latifolia]